MKHAFFILSLIVSLPAMAQSIPNPKAGESVCFGKAYSKEHLALHPSQRITAAVVEISRDIEHPQSLGSVIYVKSLAGNILTNGGIVFTDESTGKLKFPATSVTAQMGGDSGRYLISVTAKKDQIKITIPEFLSLSDINDPMDNDNVTETEAPATERMIIDSDSVDKVLVLPKLERKKGETKSCLQLLEALVK